MITASGLEHVMHAHGTNLIGEIDEIFALVKRCHEKIQRELGVKNCNFYLRIQSNLLKDPKDLSVAAILKSVQDKM